VCFDVCLCVCMFKNSNSDDLSTIEVPSDEVLPPLMCSCVAVAVVVVVVLFLC
jgi:hypothetical protein